MSKFKLEPKWVKDAKDLLVGRKIVLVRFMTHEEAAKLGWSKRPLILQLDNNTILYAMQDQVLDDGGTIKTNNNELPTIPSL